MLALFGAVAGNAAMATAIDVETVPPVTQRDVYHRLRALRRHYWPVLTDAGRLLMTRCETALWRDVREEGKEA